MNPHLQHLHRYPFQKLAVLLQDAVPPADKHNIALSMGEPKHTTPHFIQEALLSHLHGLNVYPTTKGRPELRRTIADWISHRFAIPENLINPETQVLPVNGTREALFSFAQAVIDPARRALVLMPNPFYQIYEGAALLAGAEPFYLNTVASNHYLPDFDSVPEQIWQACQLLYICSPGNPTGAVITQQSQQKLIHYAKKYDFIIAADECYTEIYAAENNPPQGLLQSAYTMGNTAFKRCIIFQSLSKRSNAPGLRSGFVAGDAEVLSNYFQYRTYQGCAMPLPTQYASIRAWQDEEHVVDNRELYREKFAAVNAILADVCTVRLPGAGFYLWLETPGCDMAFARELYVRENITVLPGSFLSREFNGINPGKNHVRLALVAPLADCIAAAERIKQFFTTLHSEKL